MIEQHPWIGPLFSTEGIDGQKIGIVGYSSWGPDEASWTETCVRAVMSGSMKARFFTDIPRYFSKYSTKEFYERVIFFEFIPGSIGGVGERYKRATAEQSAAGYERMMRVSQFHRIEKLLIFSRKAWRSMPASKEHEVQSNKMIGDIKFEFRKYKTGDYIVTAVGLKHPQYAPRSLMQSAVEAALALNVES